MTKTANWVPHTDKQLQSEYQSRYNSHIMPLFGDIFPTFNHFKAAMKGATKMEVGSGINAQLRGRSNKTMGQLKDMLPTEHHNALNIIQHDLMAQKPMPHPIVIKNGMNYHVVTGNARMDIARGLGINPVVHVINVQKLKKTEIGFVNEIEDLAKDASFAAENLKRVKATPGEFFIDGCPWNEAKYSRGGEAQLRELEINDGIFGNTVPFPLRKAAKIPVKDIGPIESTSQKEAGNAEEFTDAVSVPKNVTLNHLWRSYKHTPHHPLSVYLKYGVHLLENADKYKSAPAAGKKQMDADWLKFHQKGGAKEKNGDITVAHLHSFIENNPHILKDLVKNQKELHDHIRKYAPEAISNVDGEDSVVLHRGLKAKTHKQDHSLASYSSSEHTASGFGSNTFSYHVPLKNVWYSYDIGDVAASSANHGPENEWLVSEHPRKYAEDDGKMWHPARIHANDNAGDAKTRDTRIKYKYLDHAATNLSSWDPKEHNIVADAAANHYLDNHDLMTGLDLPATQNVSNSVYERMLNHKNKKVASHALAGAGIDRTPMIDQKWDQLDDIDKTHVMISLYNDHEGSKYSDNPDKRKKIQTEKWHRRADAAGVTAFLQVSGVPADIVDRVAKGMGPHAVESLARNPDLTPDQIDKIIEGQKGLKVGYQELSNNPQTTTRQLRTLLGTAAPLSMITYNILESNYRPELAPDIADAYARGLKTASSYDIRSVATKLTHKPEVLNAFLSRHGKLHRSAVEEVVDLLANTLSNQEDKKDIIEQALIPNRKLLTLADVKKLGPVYAEALKSAKPLKKSDIFADICPWTAAKYNRGSEQVLRNIEEKEGIVGNTIPNRLSKADEDDAKNVIAALPKVENLNEAAPVNEDNLVDEAKNQVSVPKGVQLHHLLRSYKHTPHQPFSVYLKYGVHLLENAKDYVSMDGPKKDEADDRWLKFHQQGVASTKNGNLTINHLRTFYHQNPHILKDLVQKQKELHDHIREYAPYAIKTVAGKETLPLVRGLKTVEHGPDHTLSSYADFEAATMAFGANTHAYNVPLENIWHSYDIGNEKASSETYGPENEWVVSPHPRHAIPANEIKTLNKFVPYGYHFLDGTTPPEKVKRHYDVAKAEHKGDKATEADANTAFIANRALGKPPGFRSNLLFKVSPSVILQAVQEDINKGLTSDAYSAGRTFGTPYMNATPANQSKLAEGIVPMLSAMHETHREETLRNLAYGTNVDTKLPDHLYTTLLNMPYVVPYMPTELYANKHLPKADITREIQKMEGGYPAGANPNTRKKMAEAFLTNPNLSPEHADALIDLSARENLGILLPPALKNPALNSSHIEKIIKHLPVSDLYSHTNNFNGAKPEHKLMASKEMVSRLQRKLIMPVHAFQFAHTYAREDELFDAAKAVPGLQAQLLDAVRKLGYGDVVDEWESKTLTKAETLPSEAQNIARSTVDSHEIFQAIKTPSLMEHALANPHQTHEHADLAIPMIKDNIHQRTVLVNSNKKMLPDQLRAIYKQGHGFGVNSALAFHPNTPGDILHKLASSSVPHAYAHPNMPTFLLDQVPQTVKNILKTKDEDQFLTANKAGNIIDAAIRNPKATLAHVRNLIPVINANYHGERAVDFIPSILAHPDLDEATAKDALRMGADTAFNHLIPHTFKLGTEKLRQIRDTIATRKDGRVHVRNLRAMGVNPPPLMVGGDGYVTSNTVSDYIKELPDFNVNVRMTGHNPDDGQTHSGEEQDVTNFMATPAQIMAIKKEGLMPEFLKHHGSDNHPDMGHIGSLGWVRSTRGKDGHTFVDEIQSDSGQVWGKHARLKEILFGGRNPEEFLHDAFLERMRQDPKNVGKEVHTWTPEGKVKYIMGDKNRPTPPWVGDVYGAIPKKAGYVPAKYGDIATQTGSGIDNEGEADRGDPTQKIVLRKAPK